jgi:hypothetical protein
VSKNGPGTTFHILRPHILDDYDLLNKFYLYRPAIFDWDEDVEVCITGGRAWDRERRWYPLMIAKDGETSYCAQ